MSRNFSKRDIERIVDERIEELLAEQNSASSAPASIDRDDPEQWPYEVLTGSDIQQASAEQLAPNEYVIRQYGVDPDAHDSIEEFKSAVENVREGN